jgi:uncharacterized ferritin-like protein (DUF455 family)
MELRDFAERILFGTTLEEKLQDPGTVTDDHPGPAIAAPEAPGRPRELAFKPLGTGKADFPGLHQLENPHERGRLLHFFGNHELLATELMALVLLRFPDAPPAFRRGVLQTLRDEQEHTRLYVRRMHDCGVTFGELPVSGFFWRAVSTMENPIDYVARLSLTFEQANLDFSRHFAGSFRSLGDNASAELLDRIYHDEIGHVAYGLKWFRRWKNPSDSDWAAFCRQLKFPLSPQRAKGPRVNTEGRRAAGLDPEFIAELEVFSQSKGRTPNVYLFNPFAEGFIARGPGFAPVKSQAALARDLANLPQFLGRQDDLVLVPRRPPVRFLASLKQAGFDLPEFVEIAPTASPTSPAASPQLDRKLGALRPWAWGPDSLALLCPCFAQASGESRAPEDCFNPTLARLYSKSWSADFLRDFLQELRGHPLAGLLCDGTDVGRTARSAEEALAEVEAIRRRGHWRVVIKETFGLAGANALRLWEPEILENQRRWIANATHDGREVVVEPWLDRAFDFSIQLERTRSGLEIVGHTGLATDLRGQFQANTAAPDFRNRPPAPVFALLRAGTEGPPDRSPARDPGEMDHAPGRLDPRPNPGRLLELLHHLVDRLNARLAPTGYLGPLGIDAFVHRTPDGSHRLKPVVEINPRYTFGRLTLELMRHACPGSHGRFELVNLTAVRKAGFPGFHEFAADLASRHPIRLEGDPVPRLREGAICLNNPETAETCLAVFRLSRQSAA